MLIQQECGESIKVNSDEVSIVIAIPPSLHL